ERLLIYGEKLKKPKMLEETFLRENSFGFLIQMIELDNKFNCFFFFSRELHFIDRHCPKAITVTYWQKVRG
ncbi:hypothetical protein ACQP3J_33595, partial [Escherichia coli]